MTLTPALSLREREVGMRAGLNADAVARRPYLSWSVAFTAR
jgi:hypothetical protein